MDDETERWFDLNRRGNSPFSEAVFGAACLVAVATFLASLWWSKIVSEQDGIYALTFGLMVGPCIGIGALLFGLFPAAFLYFQSRQKCDLHSFLISLASIAVILLEMVLLQFVPLHGC